MLYNLATPYFIVFYIKRSINKKGRRCYGPYISSSATTGKRYEQVSGGSAGGARTSRTIGRGVAELHNMSRYQFGMWERGNVGMRRTNVLSTFYRSWIMYLKDYSPYLDSSLSL